MSPLFLDVGNAFLFASGFLLLYGAYRDRNILKGYNFLGTILILLALTFFLVFYVQQGYWASLILTIPNYAYWVLVGVYVTKGRRRAGNAA